MTNGDAAFQSFLAAPVGPQLGSSTPGMVDGFSHLTLAEQSGPAMGLAQTRAANANMSVEQYHRFLQGMDGQPGVAQSSVATPFQQNGHALVNPQSVMAAPVARNHHMAVQPTYLQANGSMIGSGFPITHAMSTPMMHQNGPVTMGNVFAQPTMVNGQAAQADTADPKLAEAFDAAFAEFDDGEFQHELDNWMAVHGTTAERAQQEPTAEEWREINANLEQMADAADAARSAEQIVLQPEQEQEDARTEQDKVKTEQELVRAATDILASVSDNTSTKFKQSTFLDLMRRIRDHEVTVVDNSLVDVETGVEIATKAADNSNAQDSSTPTGKS
jgi:hypothetical protein